MSLRRGTGCCTPQQPWSTRIAGPNPQSGAAQFGLLFSVDNPCGALQDDTLLEETPLAVVAVWEGCIGDPSSPGQLALIQGHVQAINSTRSSSTPRPNLGTDCLANVRTTEPLLKLAITSCGKAGPTFIDSDSALVVPAGPAVIKVLAPTGWGEGISPPTAEAGPWTDVSLKVSACPCNCGFNPKGNLTEWGFVDILADAADRVLVRPRRARQLQMQGATAAGGTQNIGLQHAFDEAGAVIFGQTLFQGGFPFSLEVGGIPYVVPVSIAGVSQFTMRWTIE